MTSGAVEIFTRLILPLLLIAGSGYVADKRLQLDIRTINRLCLYLFVPCLAFTKVYESRVPLLTLGKASGFTALLILGMLLVGAGWGRLCRQPKSVCVASAAVLGFYNSGNYGLGLIEIIFHHDPQATAIQAMVVAAQNLMTFTLGLALIAGGQLSPRESLRAVAQYPFLYVLTIAILCRWFGLSVPTPILIATRTLGDALVPAALITLGAQMSRIAVTNRVGKVAGVILLRLLGAPALAFGLIQALGLHGILAQTLFISSGVPTAVNVTILAAEYGLETEFVSQATLFTTLLSAVTLTGVIWVAQHHSF